ncbi:MAG: porin family protein [bacterium]|nr:porin family protein [bacterium]
MNTRPARTLLITALLAVLGVATAHAQSEPAIRGNLVSDGPQFEIFVSSFASDIPTEQPLESRYETQIGVRGAYHFNNRFAVEGSLSKYGNYDAWLADLSAKAYLKNRGRVAAYAVGGPGMIFGSDFASDEMTVHLGLGLEIAAGQHLYVRPEVRGVALAKDLSSTDALFSLGVGWRM